MEASEEIGRLENGSSSRSGRPPNPPTAADRTGLTNDRVVVPRKKSLVRHASLIPFADFLNHDGLSEAVVLHDEDKQLSEVIAEQDYAPKEEVWITYGKFPNSTLLLDFGFSLPYNSYDEGAALSFKYYQHCFSSKKESVVLSSYELS
ncbi:hypothetical protein WN944_023747 [Citrus x changshan-huyou]|uniref:SET domain-containing protein n=1 Tax=Citrus x changshan-huyou TaxID=2935761 RepID=A0AAP0LMM6_9ROSI